MSAPPPTAPPPLRLRQLCLVAQALEPVLADLCAVFGVPVCHRDPAVAHFGLHNALVAMGTGFVEVVSPLREGTAAGRYLERRGGDGGYMVILDTPALAPWRAHLPSQGVRLAAELALGGYEGLQLHPRDTGGALLEINCTQGGEALDGAYGPAGPHWQQAVDTRCTLGLAGAVLQAADPASLARRWGAILQREARPEGDGWQLALDNAARLRFVEARDGRGEGLAGIEVQVRDPAAVRAAAAARGLATDAAGLMLGGTRFLLRRGG